MNAVQSTRELCCQSAETGGTAEELAVFCRGRELKKKLERPRQEVSVSVAKFSDDRALLSAFLTRRLMMRSVQLSAFLGQ